MSDIMLYGVLRMPYEMAMDSELSRRQFYQRVQEAADRLEAAESRNAALGRAAPAGQRDADFVVPAGYALVPAEINAVIRIGFAYVDAARAATPKQHWAFSHAGWRALLAESSAIIEASASPVPRAQGGNTCATCNDSGIVGRAPDDYCDCPDCIAARTQADAGKAVAGAQIAEGE